MANKKKGCGCLGVIGLLIILAFLGSLIGDGDKKDTATTTEPAKQEQTSEPAKVEKKPESKKVEITTTAAEISKAFNANELKGKETYTGKRATITGTVQSVGEMVGQKFVVLDGDVSNPSNLTSVQCYIKKGDDATIKKAMELQKGQSVTIEGTIGEMSMNVAVDDIIIK